MKEIPLTRGFVTQVDDEDYDWLMQFAWSVQDTNPGSIYAARGEHVRGTRGEAKRFLMHRDIMLHYGEDRKLLIDHRDTNGLNNQKENLRWATRSQNGANRHLTRNSASGYRGVYARPKGEFQALIRAGGRKAKLRGFGTFESAVEAAAAYNEAALEHFGEFAMLNKI